MDGGRRLQRRTTKKLENLSLRLHDLTRHMFEQHNHEIEKYYYLENAWTDVINESLQVYMTNKSKLQQRAIWEFLETEKNYIKRLALIVQVFLQSFKLIQGEGELKDVHQKDVFSNINEIFLAHDQFWTNQLQEVLEKSRAKKTPIIPSELLERLYRFDETFAPYLQFCMSQKACLNNIRYVMEETESKFDNQINFKNWLTWCQHLPNCERVKLVDLMTEPMQRLLRYPLLLRKICSETTDEDESRKLEIMIRSAERFAYNINKAVRTKEEKLRLELCLKEFDYYSVMDAGCEEVKWIAIDFLRLNVQGLSVDEPRCILKHAPMKMVERKGKTEQAIELFLFTDLIALARTRRSTNKLTIIRQLYFLDKVKLLKSQSSETGIVFIYLDEAGLLATTFVLEVSNSDRDIMASERERKKKDASYERDTWVTTILKAKKIYEKARKGLGSTLDYFQDDPHANKPEIEHKMIPPRQLQQHVDAINNNANNNNNNVNKNNVIENTYDALEIALTEKTNQNENIAFRSRYGESHTLPSRPTTNDHTANWVLTNKEQRGSITSDISSEHCRIGESFKSNKSDSDIIPSSDSGVSIRTCSSVPELANVEKLRAVPRLQSYEEDEKAASAAENKNQTNSLNNDVSRSNSDNSTVYDQVCLPLNDRFQFQDKETQTDFG